MTLMPPTITTAIRTTRMIPTMICSGEVMKRPNTSMFASAMPADPLTETIAPEREFA